MVSGSFGSSSITRDFLLASAPSLPHHQPSWRSCRPPDFRITPISLAHSGPKDRMERSGHIRTQKTPVWEGVRADGRVAFRQQHNLDVQSAITTTPGGEQPSLSDLQLTGWSWSSINEPQLIGAVIKQQGEGPTPPPQKANRKITCHRSLCTEKLPHKQQTASGSELQASANITGRSLRVKVAPPKSPGSGVPNPANNQRPQKGPTPVLLIQNPLTGAQKSVFLKDTPLVSLM